MSAAADLSDLGLSEDVQKLDTQALLELYKKTGTRPSNGPSSCAARD